MIRAMVVPAVQPTQEFANPAFSGFSIPPFLNRLSYKLTDMGVRMLKKPIGQFRESIGLSKRYKVPETTFLYGISEHFLAKPTDHPATSVFTGFWFGTAEEELPDNLKAFLASGDPPLLLTFGSMPFKSRFDLQSAIIKLTEKFGVRVIVVKGWGLDQTDKLENNAAIKVISGAPYEKLFPSVKAVIHHGGVGTTAACLRAGKPFLICPILYPVGDQEFWGQVAYKKGIAVRPVPVSKMTENIFLERVNELLNNSFLYINAAQMKEQLQEEKGLEKAVAIIEQDTLP
ncbi:MAG: glycosyltransferase, partial [Hymenobacteraceae bacterium]|nr:glycosyltransferase [Hymenobacteraceae bacterium]